MGAWPSPQSTQRYAEAGFPISLLCVLCGKCFRDLRLNAEVTEVFAEERRGRFSNISSLQLPIFFAALREPFFRNISRKGAKGTRSRQANFRRGMQHAQLSTTRSLSLPVLTPSRRCVP